MENEENVKVRRFRCGICDSTIMVSCIIPNESSSKESKKSQLELLDNGCNVDTIELEEARKHDWGDCNCEWRNSKKTKKK